VEAKKTPLIDLLREVPANARHALADHHIPYGRLCQEAADEIDHLRARVEELKKERASLNSKVKRLKARVEKLERFWTPVTESLPPAKVPVWLIDKDKNVWIGTYIDDGDSWKWASTNGLVCYVSDQGWYAMETRKDAYYRPTHWAHLSQPPKAQ
jgi:hypothetical protein